MTLQKEILLPEEIDRLVATRFDGEKTEIHRAFIFGLYTGARWCDTSKLTYRNVDYTTKTLRFQQQKPKGTQQLQLGYSSAERHTHPSYRTAGKRRLRRAHIQGATL